MSDTLSKVGAPDLIKGNGLSLRPSGHWGICIRVSLGLWNSGGMVIG